jgi:hypothetical protein
MTFSPAETAMTSSGAAAATITSPEGNGNNVFAFAAGFGHDAVSDFGHDDRIEFDRGVFLHCRPGREPSGRQ